MRWLCCVTADAGWLMPRAGSYAACLITGLLLPPARIPLMRPIALSSRVVTVLFLAQTAAAQPPGDAKMEKKIDALLLR